MTATPNERNLHYPLDVEFKHKEGREFLVEKGKKYIPKFNSFIGLSMFLEIFELNSQIDISEESCFEKLIGRARFRDIDTYISFFGCDRELRHIDIVILSSQNIKNSRKKLNNGFYFIGHEQCDYEPYYGDKEVVEESVEITFFIHNLQFQKIKHSLEKKLIKNIYCDLQIFNSEFSIDGLYVEDSLYPSFNYKILYAKERISNNKDLPENFIENGNRFYKENFYIYVQEKSSFDLDKTHNSEDENKYAELIKEDNSNIVSVDDDIEITDSIKENYVYQIKIETLKYIPYCFWALVIIIAKLYF